MSKPGALVPNTGTPVVLTTTANTAAGGGSLRLAVTAAGSIMVRYSSGPDVELHYPTAGVYYEPGAFSQMWLPGAGAVTLVPVDTVVALR